MRDSDSSKAPRPSRSSPSPWWLRWLIKPVLSLVGLGLAALLGGICLIGVGLAVAYPQLPEVSGLSDYQPKIPLRVYSADRVLIGEFGEEKRDFLPINQIPQVMRDAVLAIEDARFYQHG